jgi:hypothetical protein
LVIFPPHGKGNVIIFFELFARFLEGCRCANGGVKGQIIRAAIGWARLDITAAFPIGFRLRSAATMLAHHIVQGGI